MFLNLESKDCPRHTFRLIILFSALTVAGIFLFSGHSAQAATRTWKGITISWATAGNWEEGIAPVNGDDLVFPSSGSNKSNSNDISSLSVNSITINASGYTLAGNGITLAGSFTDNSSSSTNTVSLAVTLNSTQTFSIASGVTTTFSGIISGAGGVTKNGSGTLKFSGANVYQGLTTVDAGILTLAHNTGLGTTDAATTVTNGAQLVMNGSLTVTEAITINGTGISSTGALRNSTGTSTWSGAITLGSAAQIQTDGSMGLTISGGISGTNTDLTLTSTGTFLTGGMTVSTNIIALGTGKLIKTGGGGLTNATTNTYTGDTQILAGYFYIGANVSPSTDGPLGNSANAILLGDTSGSSEAALFINGAYTVSRDITVQSGSAGRAYLGVSTASSNGTFSGNITLNKDVYITVYSSNYSATFSGVISGAGGVSVDTVNANWRGYAALTNTNTYTGDTWVGAYGQLNVGANVTAGVDGPLGNSSNNILLGGASGSGGSLFLVTGAYTITRGFTVQAGGSGTVVIRSSAAAVFSGNIALSKAVTLTGIMSTTLTTTFSGVISGDYRVTITGSGAVTLTNTNTYSGGTTINSGATTQRKVNITNSAALGTGTVTVASGATLRFNGNLGTITNLFTVSGVGSANSTSGALYNSGTNTLSGAITFAAATTLYLDSSTLTLTGGITGTNTNFTTGGSGALTINTSGFSIGSGNFVFANKDVTLSVANTYTGTTTVTGSGSGATLILGDSGALGSSSSASVASGRYLRLSGGISIGNIPLALTGYLASTSGNNSWAGAITCASGNTISSDADTLTLTGGITGTNIGTTYSGSGNITISTVGITTGSGTVIKSGTGTLTIAAASTYTGLTTVSAGVLNLQNDTAAGTTAGGVTVASGAALELQGGITVGAEVLTLNNTGVSAAGCLRNISGNNSWAGAITLSTNAVRINSDADLLTLTGGITGAINLTVGGSGNVTIGTSGINTGASKTLTKDGGGTLTISASGNYTGLTTVSAGVLNLQNATATGTTAGGVGVTAGAAVQMQGGITVGAEALTLNSTGVDNDGALRNISGNNIWQGAITLNTASRINSDADLLTLSGGISGDTKALTVGGAGNVTVSSVIGTTTGTLDKDGAGNLTLSAANTLTGLTTITAGIITYGIDLALPTGNSITISSGGTLDIAGYNATSTTINNSGIFKLFGNETVSGSVTNNTDSWVYYYGASGPYNLKNWTYYSLELASGVSTTYNLPADLTINGDLTIDASNTLDAVNGSDFDIGIKGDWSNSGAFTARGGIVTFSSTTAAQTLSGTMTGGSAFNTLILTNTYGTNDPGCGTSFTPGIIFVAAATATNYTITTGSVRVQYYSGSTYTFTNINWNGQATETKIYFRNSALDAGTWLLNVSGTQTAVSYVDVARSNASGGDQIAASDGTNTNCNDNTNWYFGYVAPTLTFSISDNSIGFSLLLTSAPRWATGNGSGSGSETAAHTLTASTNATSGYTITVNGTTLKSISAPSHTITALASTSDVTAGAGTEQFGIRCTASGGDGAAVAPYNSASNYYTLVTAAFPDVIASDANGDDVATTFSIYYAANIASDTEAHADYATTLTYVITGNF